MAQFHDFGAEKCGGFILEQIRNSNPDYKQVFSSTSCRIGDFDWPRPDYVIMDLDTSATYALEYKPPMMSKREYVCGLGQSITYLQHHTYSGLIIPERADDGFSIGDFIKDVLTSPLFINTPISLFTYDKNIEQVKILKPISCVRTGFSPLSVDSSPKTFWCWWRDMSHSDLFQLLQLSLKYNDCEGDIYTDYIYPEFWQMLISGKCCDFDGNVRKVTDSEKSKASQKQNYRIPLVQLGLCTNLECRLTELGYNLLGLGIRYGVNSKVFLDALTYLVLVDGKHLDLINEVSLIQRNGGIPSTSSDFKLYLDNILTQQGMIGKRKPTAVSTGAKETYIRDEFKLWNKLGLLYRKNTTQYFIKNQGLDFNWQRINEVLINGKQW